MSFPWYAHCLMHCNCKLLHNERTFSQSGQLVLLTSGPFVVLYFCCIKFSKLQFRTFRRDVRCSQMVTFSPLQFKYLHWAKGNVIIVKGFVIYSLILF